MSVLKSRRHVSKLEVLNAAFSLTDYTLDKLTNPDKFPKSTRWIYGYKMSDLCLEISSNIKRANAVRVDDKYGDPRKQIQERLRLQNVAGAACEALIEYIERAYVHLPLSGRETDHWVGLVIDVEKKLEAWRKSDIDAYKAKYTKR